MKHALIVQSAPISAVRLLSRVYGMCTAVYECKITTLELIRNSLPSIHVQEYFLANCIFCQVLISVTFGGGWSNSSKVKSRENKRYH